jgi:hypothetical protein
VQPINTLLEVDQPTVHLIGGVHIDGSIADVLGQGSRHPYFVIIEYEISLHGRVAAVNDGSSVITLVEERPSIPLYKAH